MCACWKVLLLRRREPSRLATIRASSERSSVPWGLIAMPLRPRLNAELAIPHREQPVDEWRDESEPEGAPLVERIVDLTIERDAYRLLAQQAIHKLHDLTRDSDRLRGAYHRLLDERRRRRVEAKG